MSVIVVKLDEGANEVRVRDDLQLLWWDMSFASRWSISRRDNNDVPLAKMALEMGCILRKEAPLDYWFWWAGISKAWTPMDIKDPAKKGHADEFTIKQKKFMRQCDELGAHYEIWRTSEDIEQSRRQAMVKAA